MQAGADSEIINVDGDTALIIAVREESIESVRVLLDAGAKVDGLDRKRWTPLVHAATLGLERIAELLVERGADVDARTAGSSTPLHEAAAYGDRGRAAFRAAFFGLNRTLLLDAGADIEAQDFSNGNTPLLTAAWNGQDGALSELIRHGGRTSALAFYDLGALHRAAQFPQNERVMQLLLDEGIRLDKMSEFGATPANEAARYGNKMNVQFLLTEGADPSLHGVPVCGCIDVETDSSERGCPPGHCRTKADVLEVEGLFARHGGNRGVDVNSTTDLGTPPIAFAAYYGNIGGVRFLLSMGADPAIGFEGGNTMDDPCGCLGVAGLKDKIRCPRGAACQTEGQIAELEELMGRKRTAEAPRSGDPSLPQRDADSVACESLPLVLQQLECTASADPAK
eukprot:evm.model.scf_155.8 EVM.evm.TU.scf_155.8   scf_155:94475-99864(-)